MLRTASFDPPVPGYTRDPLSSSRLRRGAWLVGSAAWPMLAGCTGPQSTLAPAGRAAREIADLFWGLTIGGTVIWLAIVALAIYAGYFQREPRSVEQGMRLIVGGGVVFPTVVLTGVLTYSLTMLPELLAPAPAGTMRVLVTGEQWWWRVRYLDGADPPIDLANELHLPVGQTVEIELESTDVIHSFWIPALGGKVDMIPGRRTRLRLEPERTGVYRGVCAEYCGTSHALMSFVVVVEEREAFDRWLALQAEEASTPSEPSAVAGGELFLSHGCGACHAVRGTLADGVVGPDLTHVGSRASLAAGVLTNDRDAFAHWIIDPEQVKPDAHMPAFGMVGSEGVQSLAIYLEGLQ